MPPNMAEKDWDRYANGYHSAVSLTFHYFALYLLANLALAADM